MKVTIEKYETIEKPCSYCGHTNKLYLKFENICYRHSRASEVDFLDTHFKAYETICHGCGKLEICQVIRSSINGGELLPLAQDLQKEDKFHSINPKQKPKLMVVKKDEKN